MKNIKNTLLRAVATVACLAAIPAHSAMLITEVAPWSSGNSLPLAADWFELTNTGPAAVIVTGWKMDDSSNSFATAVTLNGITSIGAGQSAIYLEGANLATLQTNFINTWFGGTAPAGLLIGNYSGGGVGLSTGGDGVSVFDGAGALQAKIAFGVSDATVPFQSFDNTAGLNNATISLLSQVGVNGAFTAAAGGEVGSPGLAAIPEPETYALLLAGLGLLGVMARKRAH